MRAWLYGRWKKSGLLADFRSRIHSYYSVIYPMREELAEKKTVSVAFICIAVFIAGGGFLMSFGGRDASYVVFCLCILILLQRYVTYAIFSREAVKLKEEMLVYLTRLTSSFAADKDLEEALGRAVDEKQPRMANHGNLFCELMDKNALSGEREEYLSQYVRNISTTHLAELYMICEMTDYYGDGRINGFSRFITNINYIKENIREELLLGRKRKNEFAMLAVISFLPFFLMRPIEAWARSVADSLLPYYEGRIELFGTAMVFIFTSVCFYVIQLLEFPSEFETVRVEKSVPVFMKKADEKISDLIRKIIYANYTKSLKKSVFIEEATGEGLVEYYRRRLLWAAAGFLLTAFVCGEAMGLRARVTAPAILAGAVSSFVPYAFVIIRHNAFAGRKKGEILVLETVILILSGIKKITVDEILKNMEDFSVCYKKRIEKAVDLYQEKGTESLAEFVEEEKDDKIAHLFEGLMACDRVEPDEAFTDLKEDRAYYMAILNEEGEFAMKNEAALAKMLSFLPFFAVVLIKLVIPFVLDGLDKIGSF